jgi:hypothetical protein
LLRPDGGELFSITATATHLSDLNDSFQPAEYYELNAAGALDRQRKGQPAPGMCKLEGSTDGQLSVGPADGVLVKGATVSILMAQIMVGFVFFVCWERVLQSGRGSVHGQANAVDHVVRKGRLCSWMKVPPL